MNANFGKKACIPSNIDVVHHTGLFPYKVSSLHEMCHTEVSQYIYNTYELDRLGKSSVVQCIMHPAILAMGCYWVAHFHLVHSVDRHILLLIRKLTNLQPLVQLGWKL